MPAIVRDAHPAAARREVRYARRVELRRVLGVAGWQGSGKTTLLEGAIAALAKSGLAVAAVKRDVHGLAGPPAGKDSERLSAAGAAVFAVGPGEVRAHWRWGAYSPVVPLLAELERRYDLVLVEGCKGEGAVPKVWLGRPGEAGVPAAARGVIAELSWGEGRAAAFLALAAERLRRAWAEAPLRAGILAGGASRRMGQPKAALAWRGATLGEHVAAALAAAGAGPVTWLGGGGAAAPSLPDAPGVSGPLAGILAALRWAPATWVVASCDLPEIGAAAVEWLCAKRQPGVWAVLPRVDGEVQPLLAVYEPQVLPRLEALAAAGPAGPSQLAGTGRVATPEPPAELAPAWRGVNTPAELAAARARAEAAGRGA